MLRRSHLIAIVLVLLAALPVLSPPSFGLTDHLVFWQAGSRVASGSSPYDVDAWADTQRRYDSAQIAFFLDQSSPVWVYPAWTAYLFVPFGLLPYPLGLWALHVAYLGAGLLSAVAFARTLPPSWRPNAGLGVVAVTIFQPTVIAARYGQFGGFLLLGTVLVYIGLQRRRTLPLLAGAVILFTKPQLFLVLVPVVLTVLIRERAWRRIGAVSLTLIAIAAVTTALYPESIAVFGRGATERTAAFSQYSTTWALAHALSDDSWPILAISFVAAAAAAVAWAIRSLPPELRLAGLVAGAGLLSLVVAPVDFHYDQAPLVLAIVLAVAVGRRPYQLTLTWAAALVVPWLLFFIELAVDSYDIQSLSGAVPLLAALVLVAAASGRGRADRPPVGVSRP